MNDDTRLRDGIAPRAASPDLAAGAAGAGVRAAPGVDAALDLGTNNCRLLIACPNGDGFRVIDSFSRIIRLGEGISATGRISDAPTGRPIPPVALGRDNMHSKNANRLRLIATEACRAASNADSFRDQVESETGISLE